jgi:hypothetical protein
MRIETFQHTNESTIAGDWGGRLCGRSCPVALSHIPVARCLCQPLTRYHPLGAPAPATSRAFAQGNRHECGRQPGCSHPSMAHALITLSPHRWHLALAPLPCRSPALQRNSRRGSPGRPGVRAGGVALAGRRNLKYLLTSHTAQPESRRRSQNGDGWFFPATPRGRAVPTSRSWLCR